MMSVNWTNTQIYKLIDMFREREFLWNNALEECKDRMKKHNAWCEIATEFNLEKQIVEKKMKSLIGQFQRELRKIKSGTGGDETSKWFAFKKLIFLKDQYKPGTNIETGCEEKFDDSEKEQSAAKDDNGEREPEFPTPHFGRILKRSRTRHEKDNTPVDTLSLLRNMCEPQQRRDEFDVFGEHVAIKLRKLKNSYAKNTAQFHINNILYNADMGDYDWPSNNDRWNSRTPSTTAASRSMNEYNNFRGHNIPGPAFACELSNDGSVSMIEDIKCDLAEN